MVLRNVNSTFHDSTDNRNQGDGVSSPSLPDEKYRRLIESLPAIVYQVEPAPPFRPVFLNRRIETLGYSLEELQGAPGLWRSRIHPEDRDKVTREIETALATRQATEHEYRMIARDGTLHWFHDQGRFVTDESDKAVWQGVIIDITERKKMEGALEQSEERYRRIVEKASDIIYRTDINGFFTFVNPRAMSLMGVSSEAELIGRQCLSVIRQDYQEKAAEFFRKQFFERQPDTYSEFPVIAGDGTEVWFGQNVQLLTEGNKVLGFQVLARDVSARRRAEEALRESEARYRVLYENAVEGIFQNTIDGRIRSANPALARMLGYDSPEDLVRSMTDITHQHYVDPARRAEILRLLEDHGVVHGVEYEAFRKDGSRIWVSENARAVRDASGKMAYLEGTLADITERKRAEELRQTLDQAAVEWRLTFDAIDSPILIFDADNRVTRLNRAACDLLGGKFHEIVGRHIREIAHGQPWQAAEDLLRHVIASGTTASSQASNGASGKTWDIMASRFNSTGAMGDLSVLVLRDITWIVTLQESLRRSELMSAMGSLVAGVAHEVRNPLFGISATLDAFEAKFSKREEFQKYITLLRSELDRLITLMRDLLEYGKPLNLELSPGSISEVVEQAARITTPENERPVVKIANRVTADLPVVLLDAPRLHQVFQNLIANAVYHSPRGGTVTVDAEEVRLGGQRWVDCVVKDEGPGFRAEDLSKIFEPFFTRRRGGTGLGLSIVQRIVEGHSGKILAGNRPEGGAMVIVRLPVLENKLERGRVNPENHAS